MPERLIGTGVMLFLLSVETAWCEPLKEAEARVVAQLEELGIRVRRDQGGQVSHIGFPRGSNADLLRGASMYLAQLSPFKSLGLSGAELRDEDLMYIANLDIQILYLHDTKISSDAMKYLRGMRDLRTLWLFKTEIDDRVFDQLKSLPKLNYVHVYGTAVSDQAIVRFVAVRPKCSVIR